MINLRNGQITDLLNNGMRYNPETIAIGYAIHQEKQRIMVLADHTRLMSSMDLLDEKIIDILAVELRTPAYDDSFPLKTKQALVAKTLDLYAHLGTKGAMLQALNDIYPGTSISEWFEYGGTPYCFKISLPISGKVTLERQRRILSKVWYYKNLRSHLEAFQMELETSGNVRVGAYTMAIETVEVWPGPITGVEIGGAERTAAYAQQVQTMEVYPGPITGVEIGGVEHTAAYVRQAQTVEVYPEY